MDPKKIDVYIVDAQCGWDDKAACTSGSVLVPRGQLEGRHVCVKGEMVIHNGKLD